LTRSVKYLRPLHLLFASLTYLLGASMAKYLGMGIRWPAFWIGLFSVIALQVAGACMQAYFDYRLAPEETRSQAERTRAALLLVSMGSLALAAVLIVTLLLTHSLSLPAGVVMLIATILLVANSMPPLRLLASGYGELIQAFLLASAYPAFAYLLQAEDLHRILSLATFPLTLLAIAWLLAADFSTYAEDQRLARKTLLIRITWQRTIFVHNLIILIAFLTFAAEPFLGLTWGLIWPVFLALPFAALQIYWLQRIAGGGKPVWRFFNVLHPSVFGLTVYLLVLAFWMR
jgi:1,4-dihydroxy-2-naphthoate octaprenyltransferase